jgi:hypothetical protein
MPYSSRSSDLRFHALFIATVRNCGSSSSVDLVEKTVLFEINTWIDVQQRDPERERGKREETDHRAWWSCWRRWRGDGGADVGVEAAATMDFPSPTAPLLDRSREGGGAVTVAVNLVSCAPGPHLLFIRLRDRGPPTRSRLSISDQDAVKGSELAVGPIRLRSILTFSSLISTCHLTLNFDFNCFHFYLFHHKSVYRACLIVTVSRR